jgi:GDP-4-dehydro-6-deoxy-D-mannose reductase
VKALITGTGGFVGRHLAHHLLRNHAYELVGTTFLAPDQYPHLSDLAAEGMRLQHVELTDADSVKKLLDETKPDQIYHLAAQAFVPESFENPWYTLSNNIQAQLNILHSVLELDLDTRVLVVGSSEVYGTVKPEDIPIDEDQPLQPANPYSVSKVAQDMLGLQYYLSHNIETIRVRPFNQIGPGQSNRFVAPAFASQIAAIEKGEQEPVLRVGNLVAKRDFTDVRDMVNAYYLVMQQGQPGDVYNTGSGEAHSIRELLDILLNLTDAPIRVETDPSRMRPVDVPVIACDNSKINAATGWKPTITFEQSLADVLTDWRTR